MKRRGILEFMKKCVTDPAYDPLISENAKLTSLIERLFYDFYIHYGLKDIEECGKHKHQLRFFLTYIDRNKMSYAQISEETLLDISNDTFKYHIRNYNKTVLLYLTEESNVNPDIAILLAEYAKKDC